MRAYSHQGHGPRADQQAGYIPATSDSTPSLKGWRKEGRERGAGDLVRAAFERCLQQASPLEKFLPDVEAAHPEYLLEYLSEHGIEERPANVSRIGMLYALIAIAFAVVKFPRPESPEK